MLNFTITFSKKCLKNPNINIKGKGGLNRDLLPLKLYEKKSKSIIND